MLTALLALSSLPLAAQDAAVARVPLRPLSGLIVFDVEVAGQGPFTFLLDSGASGAVIDADLADRLELAQDSRRVSRGAVQGSRVERTTVRNVTFDVGGAPFVAKQATTAPVAPLFRAMIGAECQGILGHDFFQRYTVEVDYVEHELVLHEPEGFPGRDGYTTVPLSFDPQVAHLPFTDVVLDNGRDEPFPVRMLVDSGGNIYGTGSLGSKADHAAIVPPELPVHETRGATGLGSSPENVSHGSWVARFTSLEWAGHRVPGPLIGWTKRSVPFGVLGAQLLSRFDVVFDYRRGRLLLSPNERFTDPLTADTSGLMIVASVDDATVRQITFVTPDSPADEAGLQRGDELLSIEGRPVAERDLMATRELFMRPGEYRLEVRRGEETFECIMSTRRLL